MPRPETLIARNREGVQRLDPEDCVCSKTVHELVFAFLIRTVRTPKAGVLHWPVAAKRCPEWATSASVSVSCATGDFAFVVSGWRCAATAYDAPGPRVVAPLLLSRRRPATATHTVIATPRRTQPHARSGAASRGRRPRAGHIGAQRDPVNRGVRALHARSMGCREKTVNQVHSLLTSPLWSLTPTLGCSFDSIEPRSGAPARLARLPASVGPCHGRGGVRRAKVPQRPGVACVLR